MRAADRTALCRVVILTTSDEPADLGSAYGNEANACVRKPVNGEEFADAVHRAGLRSGRR